jgi:hypothetical protein
MAIETPVSTDGFLDDVRASLGVWRKAPLLPMTTTLVAAVSSPYLLTALFESWAGAILIPIELFAIGWFGGTQLIWYRRAFDGRPMRPGELIPLTWSMIARYFWLYFLAVVPIVVVVFAAIWRPTLHFDSPVTRAGLLAYGVVLAMVLTFMNPALAFSTRRVSKAIPIGLGMLVQGWPANWGYIFVPGVVGGALGSAYWFVPSLGRAVLEMGITLIYFIFAGAIARHYLRSQVADA